MGNAHGRLPPDPKDFENEKGRKWTLEVLSGTDKRQKLPPGTIYSNSCHRLGFDKSRTSCIDGTVFWNFGDCLSIDGIVDGCNAGWSMGAAFYASKANPLEVNMYGRTTVSGADFACPWTGHPNPDPVPPPDWQYGMDTSNTVQVAPGKGIGFAFEIHRKPDGSFKDLGNAVFEVQLGKTKPIARRFCGLITGHDKVQLGLMTVFNPNIKNSPNADGYIYIYCCSAGIWDSVVVGRVPVEHAFNPSKYQFLKKSKDWDAEGVIPKYGDTDYGMEGSPVSNSQGSIMYNEHLERYILFCGTLGHNGSFCLSETPYGPWSRSYLILSSEEMRYGVNVHPDLLTDSNGREMLVSWGTNVVQTMYKLTLNY